MSKEPTVGQRAIRVVQGVAAEALDEFKKTGLDVAQDMKDRLVARLIASSSRAITQHVRDARRRYTLLALGPVVGLAALGLTIAPLACAWVALGMGIAVAVGWIGVSVFEARARKLLEASVSKLDLDFP